jgi:hypothetical protein
MSDGANKYEGKTLENNAVFWDVTLSGCFRTDVSEKRIVSIIKVTRIGSLGTTLAVTSNRRTLLIAANVVPTSQILATLLIEAVRSSETSVLTRATQINILEDGILDSDSRENRILT